jgi:uncharacterized protein YjiS (DUF1127 family)
MASITAFDGSYRGEGVFARVRRALDDYRLYRATINELEALNSRELRDLGISRLSIREIARDSVYGA